MNCYGIQIVDHLNIKPFSNKRIGKTVNAKIEATNAKKGSEKTEI